MGHPGTRTKQGTFRDWDRDGQGTPRDQDQARDIQKSGQGQAGDTQDRISQDRGTGTGSRTDQDGHRGSGQRDRRTAGQGQPDSDWQGEAEARRCGRRSTEGHTDRKRQDRGTGLTGTGTGRHGDGNTRVGADGGTKADTDRWGKEMAKTGNSRTDGRSLAWRTEGQGQPDRAWPSSDRLDRRRAPRSRH